MFDTVISGVPWQQEAFYHQPIDTTWWVRAPPILPPCFAPDWKALGCLCLAEKKKKKREAKLSVQLQSPPCFSWNVGPLFQQGYVCIRACYKTFPWQSFPSALFILLGSHSGQPRYSEAWWFGLGDGSCGLHYWRSLLKSQARQDRPEVLIIWQLCPKLDELGAFWEKGLPGQCR